MSVAYAYFGQVNDFYVSFFKITYAEVDWATLTHYVSPLVMLLPVLWMIHLEKFGFKKVVICATASLLLSFLCTTVSLVNNNLFALVIAGQMFNGIASILLMSTPSIFATLWFPENEVGTAIAINSVGMCIGVGIGTVVPTLATNEKSSLVSHSVNANKLQHIKMFLIIMNMVMLILSAIILLFFVIFVTDVPPTPPTKAQQLKSIQKEEKQRLGFIKTSKQLFFDKTFLLACILFGITTQIVTLECIMMSEMMRELVENDLLSINADRFGGYLLAVYAAGAAVGILVTGKIMDFNKHYYILSNIASVLTFASTLAFALGFRFANLPTLFVSNFFSGFGSKALMVVLYEIATQHTYPMDEIFVSTWLTVFLGPVGVFIGEIGRVLFNSYGSLSVLIFQSVFAFACAVMTALISPEPSRLATSDRKMPECEVENNDELLSLLQ